MELQSKLRQLKRHLADSLGPTQRPQHQRIEVQLNELNLVSVQRLGPESEESRLAAPNDLLGGFAQRLCERSLIEMPGGSINLMRPKYPNNG